MESITDTTVCKSTEIHVEGLTLAQRVTKELKEQKEQKEVPETKTSSNTPDWFTSLYPWDF